MRFVLTETYLFAQLYIVGTVARVLPELDPNTVSLCIGESFDSNEGCIRNFLEKSTESTIQITDLKRVCGRELPEDETNNDHEMRITDYRDDAGVDVLGPSQGQTAINAKQ